MLQDEKQLESFLSRQDVEETFSQCNIVKLSEQQGGEDVIYLTRMEEVMDLREPEKLQKKTWEESTQRDEEGVAG